MNITKSCLNSLQLKAAVCTTQLSGLYRHNQFGYDRPTVVTGQQFSYHQCRSSSEKDTNLRNMHYYYVILDCDVTGQTTLRHVSYRTSIDTQRRINPSSHNSSRLHKAN